MSVEVRECDRKAAEEFVFKWQHREGWTVDGVAEAIAKHMQPERSTAAEEIKRLRAVVEAADGLASSAMEFHEFRDDERIRDWLESRVKQYRTARAACDSPNAKSDAQDGLSDTGDTQG